MKIAIVVLAVITLVLGWFLRSQTATVRQQQEQIQKLASQVADQSKQDGIELQEKCANQADKNLRTFGSSRLILSFDAGQKANTNSGNLDSFQSHYNARLNKCFMTIDSTDTHTNPGMMFINKHLLDAYRTTGIREFAPGY